MKTLLPIVKLDGEWLDADAALAHGLVLAETAENGTRRVTLENRSGATIRPEELGWRKSGRDDFDVPGLKVYVDPSASGYGSSCLPVPDAVSSRYDM